MNYFELFRHDPNTQKFAAGETIFSEGDEGREMFLIVEGEIAIERHGALLEKLGPGGIFGEMGLVEHAPRAATARAVTGAEAVRIDERRFTYLVQNTPHFAIEVMRVMAGRLRHMDERV